MNVILTHTPTQHRYRVLSTGALYSEGPVFDSRPILTVVTDLTETYNIYLKFQVVNL